MAAVPADDPAWKALSDQWIVILASERDAKAQVPGLATVNAHRELGASPVVFPSGRFKNLMPCYTVTAALATSDKAAALAMSKQLTGLGVDNYVKNAGAWVGRSSAIEAYCAGGAGGGSSSVALTTKVGDDVWMPVDAPDTVLQGVLSGAPSALDRGYAAWTQPVTARAVGAVSAGARYRAVDPSTGTVATCVVAELAGLTLGTPHFGVLQAPTPPKAPTCGEAKLYARLSCPGAPGVTSWVVAPEGGAALAAFAPAGPGTAAMEAAAKEALTRDTDWEEAPSGEGDVTREVHVSRWHGATDVVLVEGVLSAGNGLCAGSDDRWYAVFSAAGDTLGAPLGPFVHADNVDTLGLVDIEGDGKPEVVVHAFPDSATITAADGTEKAGLTIAYCDCPC